MFAKQFEMESEKLYESESDLVYALEFVMPLLMVFD